MVDIVYAIMLGFVAGVIPVYLGLLPVPFFRRLSRPKRDLLISFSLGILLFLFVDVTAEAVKISEQTMYSPILFAVGLVVGLGVPLAVSLRRRKDDTFAMDKDVSAKFFTAYVISVAIGLHNLGEGLAIGAAYASGQLGLTTVLVIGFIIHNGTEGMAISGPISETRIKTKELLLMGFLAGAPTILGSVFGSILYSNLVSAFFFSTAAGALLYVIMAIVKGTTLSPKSAFTGVVIGILLMYFTDLLLAF
jgi:zinc transporter ZupT